MQCALAMLCTFTWHATTAFMSAGSPHYARIAPLLASARKSSHSFGIPFRNHTAHAKSIRPNLSALRKCLLVHNTHVPILYIAREDVADKQALTLEHVVPVSLLPHTDAASDARNVFLADRYTNFARGNSRFSFHPHNTTLTRSQFVVHLGNDNYLDAGARMFYPREADWCTIARTLLYMHRHWVPDLARVTDASVADLTRLARGRCITTEEYWHMRIAYRFSHQWTAAQ